MPANAELIRRAQGGDDAAFEDLIGATQGRLFTLAVRLLGSRAEAQDMVQEAYIVAYTHLGQLDPERSPMAWLSTVTTRLCLNRLRAGKKMSGVDLDTLEGLLVDQVVGQDLEGRLDLQRALGSLTEEARAVILLYYWGGYSCKEIADMLDRSESATKVALFRARERLRRWFES